MKIAILHGPRDLRIDEQALEGDRLKPNEIWVETEISALKIGTDRGNYEGAERVPGAARLSSMGRRQQPGNRPGRGKRRDPFFKWATVWWPISRISRNTLPKSPRTLSRFPTASRLKMRCMPGCTRSADIVIAKLTSSRARMWPSSVWACWVWEPLRWDRCSAAGWSRWANSPIRLEMARKMGAHAAYLSNQEDLAEKLDEFTGGIGIDLVIQTANPWPAHQAALQVVRPNGRVAIVALPGRGEPPLDFNPLSMRWFYTKGISLIAVSGPSGYLYPNEGDRFEMAAKLSIRAVSHGRRPPRTEAAHHAPLPFHRNVPSLRDGLPPRKVDAGRHFRLEKQPLIPGVSIHVEWSGTSQLLTCGIISFVVLFVIVAGITSDRWLVPVTTACEEAPNTARPQRRSHLLCFAEGGGVGSINCR